MGLSTSSLPDDVAIQNVEVLLGHATSSPFGGSCWTVERTPATSATQEAPLGSRHTNSLSAGLRHYICRQPLDLVFYFMFYVMRKLWHYINAV